MVGVQPVKQANPKKIANFNFFIVDILVAFNVGVN
jgi:hypothetical protein